MATGSLVDDRAGGSRSDAPPSRWSRLGSALVLAAIVSFVVALVASAPAAVGDDPTADQGYYVRYIRAIASGGWSQFPRLFQDWLSDSVHWISPPPSRVAFIVAGAWWSKIFGASGPALAGLSLAALVGLIVLQFAFARRHFGEGRALMIAALTACSPLYLGLSRFVLTDDFISLWQLASVWLFYEVVVHPEQWRWRAAFVFAFSVALLAKEQSLLLVAGFAAFACIERFHRGRSVPCLPLVVTLAAPGCVAVLAWVLAAGSLDALARTMRIVLASPATNTYALLYGSGPWYRYVFDPILISPWTTLLGIGSIAVVVRRWSKGDYDTVLVYLVVIYVMQIAVLAPFTKNVRYIGVLESMLRVLVVAGVCTRLFALPRRIAPTVIVLALCAADVGTYRQLFVRDELYDPITQKLLRYRYVKPSAGEHSEAPSKEPGDGREREDRR